MILRIPEVMQYVQVNSKRRQILEGREDYNLTSTKRTKPTSNFNINVNEYNYTKTVNF